jgi:hypothetical protein
MTYRTPTSRPKLAGIRKFGGCTQAQIAGRVPWHPVGAGRHGAQSHPAVAQWVPAGAQPHDFRKRRISAISWLSWRV